MTCPECPRRQKALDALLTDFENLQTEMTVVLRRERALKAELTKQRRESPEAKSVLLIFDHWRNALGKRKSVKLGPEREKKVQARLRDGFSEDDLRKAVDGCALLPFVGDSGRMASGRPHERYDDLALICRDEVTVERFMRYVDHQRELSKKTLARRHAKFLARHGEELGQIA